MRFWPKRSVDSERDDPFLRQVRTFEAKHIFSGADFSCGPDDDGLDSAESKRKFLARVRTHRPAAVRARARKSYHGAPECSEGARPASRRAKNLRFAELFCYKREEPHEASALDRESNLFLVLRSEVRFALIHDARRRVQELLQDSSVFVVDVFDVV